ncbi:MAG: hypothetical protein LRS43_00980, partial [Desulfurococcales archaeon]|nr:hypothetical protein [Desulfurococcales archaeon]
MLALTAIILLAAYTPINTTGQYYTYPTREHMRPLKGGLQIEVREWGATSGSYATLGYFVRDSHGNIGVVTAGHAANADQGIYVYQPNSSDPTYLIGPNGYHIVSSSI